MSELLTDIESALIARAGELFTVFCESVVLDGPTRNSDIREMMFHIHAIQRTIMSQAAARQYPQALRLLGGDYSSESKGE